MTKNEPAFPCAFNFSGEANQTGMSLRDYFAAAALNGLFASAIEATKAGGTNFMDESSIAANAYAFADAMLAERSKQQTT